jgi:hypothetical protein
MGPQHYLDTVHGVQLLRLSRPGDGPLTMDDLGAFYSVFEAGNDAQDQEA